MPPHTLSIDSPPKLLLLAPHTLLCLAPLLITIIYVFLGAPVTRIFRQQRSTNSPLAQLDAFFWDILPIIRVTGVLILPLTRSISRVMWCLMRSPSPTRHSPPRFDLLTLNFWMSSRFRSVQSDSLSLVLQVHRPSLLGPRAALVGSLRTHQSRRYRLLSPLAALVVCFRRPAGLHQRPRRRPRLRPRRHPRPRHARPRRPRRRPRQRPRPRLRPRHRPQPHHARPRLRHRRPSPHLPLLHSHVRDPRHARRLLCASTPGVPGPSSRLQQHPLLPQHLCLFLVVLLLLPQR